MEVAGKPEGSRLGRIVTAVAVLAAIVVGVLLVRRDVDRPATDAASIDADVVHVAAVVGGRVTRIDTRENAQVEAGQLLFEVDPTPYRQAVASAEAELAHARAELASRQRYVSNQRTEATASAVQVAAARTQFGLAARTVSRLRPLAAKGYVSAQEFDRAVSERARAQDALAQAGAQQAVARTAVDDDAAADASVAARRAALDHARWELAQTVVYAPVRSRVVGLRVRPGETVAPSQALFTLISATEWFASANFRETQLSHVRVGDCATVHSMIDRGRAIRGRVVSIGSGVVDQDEVSVPGGAPAVEKSLNWVRVAQRFPVRIRLLDPPADLVRLGATATVELRRGGACPR